MQIENVALTFARGNHSLACELYTVNIRINSSDKLNIFHIKSTWLANISLRKRKNFTKA